MAQVCDRCKKSMGFLDKWKCKDGVVCYDCIKDLDKSIRNNLKLYTVEQIKYMIDNPDISSDKAYQPQQYKCSNSVVIFNPIDRSLSITTAGFFRSEAIPYSSIMGYDYREDDQSKGRYGKMIGAAALGGLVFGGAGAIIGALTQKRGEVRYITRAEIAVSYKKEGHIETAHIWVLDSKFNDKIKSTSYQYKALLDEANKIMLMLDEIITSGDENQES